MKTPLLISPDGNRAFPRQTSLSEGAMQKKIGLQTGERLVGFTKNFEIRLLEEALGTMIVDGSNCRYCGFSTGENAKPRWDDTPQPPENEPTALIVRNSIQMFSHPSK